MSNSKIFFDNSSVKFLIFLSLINFSIYGCYSVSFYHDTDKLREIHDGEISAVRSLYFDKEDDPALIRSACPSGASLLKIKQTISDGLVNYISLGFIGPQTIKVWCKRRER